MSENRRVKVAIVGVGNCAASLVQGVHYYRDTDPRTRVPGLMHVRFGDYHVGDVEFVAAFDVDAKKVGGTWPRRSSPARTTPSRSVTSRRPGVTVQRGPDARRPRPVLPGDDRGIGRRTGRCRARCCVPPQADVLVDVPARRFRRRRRSTTRRPRSTRESPSSTPSRCLSPPIPNGRRSSTEAGLPIVGDDIKTQLGATITHRVLARLFEARGLELDRTIPVQRRRQHGLQEHARAAPLGVEENLQDPGRHRQIGASDLGTGNVHIGPRDHVPWLKDRKCAYVRLEGARSATCPLNLEYKLEVWDSPNSAGIIIDAIRAAKIAKDRGLGGPLLVRRRRTS